METYDIFQCHFTRHVHLFLLTHCGKLHTESKTKWRKIEKLVAVLTNLKARPPSLY